jgi:ABC-type branched-subunit amino acid transport system ATPase component
MALEPELMLLDEPTQGMGHEDVHRVTELIKKVSAGRTILMVEHNMNVVASIADRITVLQRGAIIADGPYAEVSANPLVIEAYMGTTDAALKGAPLMSKELLRIEGLNAWYGESHILHGVDLAVNEGEVVCLLGRNGAGRTTTMRAIVGLTGARKGSIRINGEEAIKLPPHKVARLGVGYCPEERGIFASLSAEENLMLPPVIAPAA